jgi:hypothetical protein
MKRGEMRPLYVLKLVHRASKNANENQKPPNLIKGGGICVCKLIFQRQSLKTKATHHIHVKFGSTWKVMKWKRELRRRCDDDVSF